MIVTVVNLSQHVTDEQLLPVVRAVNRQIREDFGPYWGTDATLRLEGRLRASPDKKNLRELRGDAVLYLWDKIDLPGAVGYHEGNALGVPYGLVFTDLAEALKEPWSVTLSHEALELIGDPHINQLAAGPHPEENRTVFHWFEMCDAVQEEHYEIDGVQVSNFVLPLYFTPASETGSRNDFLGRRYKGKSLSSFGINPGGYIGFFDPQTGKDVTFANAGDQKAKQRLHVKKAKGTGRRSYRLGVWPHEAVADMPRVQRGMATATSAKSGKQYEQID